MHRWFADNWDSLLMVRDRKLNNILTIAQFQSGAIGLANQIFYEQKLDILLRDAKCNGSENTLLACDVNTRRTFCGPRDDSGVVCQGMNFSTGRFSRLTIIIGVCSHKHSTW